MIHRLLVAIALAALVLAGLSNVAWSAFLRNDAYQFRSPHILSVHGREPDSLTLDLGSEVDFRTFRFQFKVGNELGPDPLGPWWFVRVQMDIDDDGSIELETDSHELVEYTYTFAQPVNNIQQQHVIRFRMFFQNAGGQGTWRTEYVTVTVFATPRVYVETDGTTLIQVRDEPCGDHRPILVVEGFDPGNQAAPDVIFGPLADFANQSLFPAGYELFILNFANGGASVRDNAIRLQSALDNIHGLCPSKRVGVLGISMGGVIARYALAKAETDGIDHHAGLFISYDSPQAGAYANHALQDNIRVNATGTNAGLVTIKTLLNSVAAKELLEYNTYDPTKAMHTALFAELNSLNNGLGYPRLCYNAAVANGNYNASWPASQVGTDFATLSLFTDGIWGGSFKLDFHLVAAPPDCATGSLTKMSMSKTGYVATPFCNWPLVPAFFGAHYKLTIAFDPVFIPTWSSLDLSGSQTQSTGNLDPIGQTPFDAAYVQPTRIYHTDIGSGTAAKVGEWLAREQPLTIQYEFIEGGALGSDQYMLNVLDTKTITVLPRVVTVNGQQLTCEFAGWDDNNTENPRTFSSPRGMVHKAYFKMHLATTASGVTWASSQTRLVEEGEPGGLYTRHAVYESGGGVWYTRNRWNAGWEMERRLSDAKVVASAPVLKSHTTGQADQAQLYAAWIEPNGAVTYRASNFDNGTTWKDPVTMVGCAPSTPLLPTPWAVMWVESAVGECVWPGIYYWKQPDTNVYGEPLLVPGTSGNISSAAVYRADDYELVYVKDGSLWHVAFEDPDLSNYGAAPVLSTAAISLSAVGWTAANPAVVAASGGAVYVAWEETNGSSQRIAFRQKVNGTWSSTAYFTHESDVPTRPVLQFYWVCGPAIDLAWQCGDHIARVSRLLAGSEWSPVVHLASGRAPSPMFQSADKLRGMWVSGGAAPYAVVLVDSIACADRIAPSTVGDLQTELVSPHSITLMWSAPGDDGSVGTAESYDLRWATQAITAGTWDLANRVADESAPQGAGEYESFTQAGLSANTWYWFALRTRDDGGNWSSISNVVHQKTLGGGGGGYSVWSEGGGMSSSVAGSAVQEERMPLIVEKHVGSGEWKVFRGGVSDSAVVEKYRRGADGEWKLACAVPDVPAGEPLCIRLARSEDARLVFQNTFGVGQIARVVGGVVGGSSRTVLARIDHSTYGDLRGQITTEGLGAVAIGNGDTLTFAYGPGVVDEEAACDWTVMVRGEDVASIEGGVAEAMVTGAAVPARFALAQNQPNPFSDRTRVGFEVPRAGRVKIAIFDLQGRSLGVVVDREVQAGMHSVELARSLNGGWLRPGVYLCRMQAGAFAEQKKVVVLP